jgi:hypothetical protein
MCNLCNNEHYEMARRDFIKTIGISVAGVSLGAGRIMNEQGIDSSVAANRKIASIRGAFLYPPSNTLEKEGYYSWPGSDFDAEGRQIQYMSRIKEIERNLDIRIEMDQKSLDVVSDVDNFIAEIKTANPDGLLLIPFKKSHCEHIIRIVEETKIPTVVLASLGILLIEQILPLRDRTGVYMINSLDDLDAVESGLKMIKTSCWMRDAVIVSIDGNEVVETLVPFLGTKVRRIPHQRFYDNFASQKADENVLALAKQYMSRAEKIVHPTKEDVIEAAKNYFVFKKILAEEKADALMMNCLPGLSIPHKHVPPCMGFMSLMDEGIPMGCQADLNATLTMMLLKSFFGKPGFMHNVSYNTEKNLYYCAHCTSPSRMNGFDRPAEPYELMSHCESGWGTVPRVLFKEGQEVTIAKYLVNEKTPQLFLYSGEIIDCPPIPATGGCRTNVETTINELARGSDLKGRSHMVMFYGHYVKQLRQFCQLYNIEVVV